MTNSAAAAPDCPSARGRRTARMAPRMSPPTRCHASVPSPTAKATATTSVPRCCRTKSTPPMASPAATATATVAAAAAETFVSRRMVPPLQQARQRARAQIPQRRHQRDANRDAEADLEAPFGRTSWRARAPATACRRSSAASVPASRTAARATPACRARRAPPTRNARISVSVAATAPAMLPMAPSSLTSPPPIPPSANSTNAGKKPTAKPPSAKKIPDTPVLDDRQHDADRHRRVGDGVVDLALPQVGDRAGHRHDEQDDRRRGPDGAREQRAHDPQQRYCGLTSLWTSCCSRSSSSS